MSIRVYVILVAAAIASAQPPQGFGGRGPQSENLRTAQQAIRERKNDEALTAVRKELAGNPNSMAAGNLLDALGQTADAKKVFQRVIDNATEPAQKANAQRSMAMSYAYDGDCRNAIKFEQMVIAYWETREQAEQEHRPLTK